MRKRRLYLDAIDDQNLLKPVLASVVTGLVDGVDIDGLLHELASRFSVHYNHPRPRGSNERLCEFCVCFKQLIAFVDFAVRFLTEQVVKQMSSRAREGGLDKAQRKGISRAVSKPTEVLLVLLRRPM